MEHEIPKEPIQVVPLQIIVGNLVIFHKQRKDDIGYRAQLNRIPSMIITAGIVHVIFFVCKKICIFVSKKLTLNQGMKTQPPYANWPLRPPPSPFTTARWVANGFPLPPFAPL